MAHIDCDEGFFKTKRGAGLTEPSILHSLYPFHTPDPQLHRFPEGSAVGCRMEDSCTTSMLGVLHPSRGWGCSSPQPGKGRSAW